MKQGSCETEKSVLDEETRTLDHDQCRTHLGNSQSEREQLYHPLTVGIDKDVFRTFYYKALAKRLLLGRSASDFHEKKVIELQTHLAGVPPLKADMKAVREQVKALQLLTTSEGLNSQSSNSVKPEALDSVQKGLLAQIQCP